MLSFQFLEYLVDDLGCAHRKGYKHEPDVTDFNNQGQSISHLKPNQSFQMAIARKESLQITQEWLTIGVKLNQIGSKQFKLQKETQSQYPTK